MAGSVSLPPRAASTDEEWKRAFEIHRNCDHLMHQRLTAFTALQAFTITAYATLTVARFQLGVPVERIVWFEVSRIGLISFGIVSAVFGWMVTFPMLVRLRYLNETYLNDDPIYEKYIKAAHEDSRFNVLLPKHPRIDSLLRGRWIEYRTVIPIFLPLAEIGLWLVFLLTLAGAWISTWIFGTGSGLAMPLCNR